MISSLLKVVPRDKCDYVANTSDGQFITAERLVDLANDAVRSSNERGKMICRLRGAIALLLPVGINQLHEISAVMQITGGHFDEVLSEDADEDEDEELGL